MLNNQRTPIRVWAIALLLSLPITLMGIHVGANVLCDAQIRDIAQHNNAQYEIHATSVDSKPFVIQDIKRIPDGIYVVYDDEQHVTLDETDVESTDAQEDTIEFRSITWRGVYTVHAHVLWVSKQQDFEVAGTYEQTRETALHLTSQTAKTLSL